MIQKSFHGKGIISVVLQGKYLEMKPEEEPSGSRENKRRGSSRGMGVGSEGGFWGGESVNLMCLLLFGEGFLLLFVCILFCVAPVSSFYTETLGIWPRDFYPKVKGISFHSAQSW